jgi:phage terminase small subunit
MKPLTEKQELFAQSIVAGMNNADAYRKAYNVKPNTKMNTIYSTACQMASSPKIAQRIAELRKPSVRKLEITLEKHLSALQIIRNMAMKAGKIELALNAEMALAKASGVVTEKLELEGSLRGLPCSIHEFV